MPGTQPREVLKRRPWRTSEVESGPRPAFVKRFHDARFPGRAVGRWRDRRRARREARRLTALAAAGVPVPRVLGVAETAGGVELRLELLESARPVSTALAAGLAAGRAIEGPGLARALGTLLARLHAAGFAHGDLHAGNALLDGQGRAWIVDAAAIRAATPARVARDLVRAAAAARETSSPRFRARFLLAYLAAAGDARRSEASALAEALEAAGRLERRARVAAESDRWLRASGAVAPHREPGLVLWFPTTLGPASALAAARATLAGAGSSAYRVVHGRRARGAWLAQARLVEHGIPAAQPLAFVERPRRVAVFAQPRGARAPRDGSASDARALGALAGALFDRGLCLGAPAAAIGADGRAHALPGAGLVGAPSVARALRPWRAGFGTDWTRAPGFAAAFATAQRGSRVQREAVHAALARAIELHAPPHRQA
ncbi:MAG: phosphotransferase [Planctomycetes bacterium]|nr:phosphotransferase [Planctomycetota bacterium]